MGRWSEAGREREEHTHTHISLIVVSRESYKYCGLMNATHTHTHHSVMGYTAPYIYSYAVIMITIMPERESNTSSLLFM